MKAVFADTFFLLALVNAGDAHHEKARQANRVDRPVVTSGWVFVAMLK